MKLGFSLSRSEEDLVREEQEHLAQIEEQDDALKMREQEDTSWMIVLVQTVSSDNMKADQKKRHRRYMDAW